jgi:hypothetical protein
MPWKLLTPRNLLVPVSCGVLALGCYLALISLGIPGTPNDSGIYLYIGGLIADGGVPYRDALDVKNPGIFFLYGAAKYLLGSGIGNVRVFDLVWEFLTALVIGYSCRRVWKSGIAGLFGAGVYLALYFSQYYTTLAQADGMLNLPLAILFLFLLQVRESDSAVKWILAGACLGCAMLLKITAAAFGLMFLWAMFRGTPLNLAKAARQAALALFGWSIPLLACVSYFYGKGGLTEFLEAQFVIAPIYASFSRSKLTWTKVRQFYSITFVLPLLCAIVLGIFGLAAEKIRNRRFSFATTLMAVWAVSAVLCMVLQARMMNTHYMAIMGPWAMLSTIGAFVLVQDQTKWFKAAVFPVVILLLVAPTKQIWQQLSFANSGVSPDIALAWRLERLTRPEDKIHVWGNSPSIYVYSNRKPVTRFITHFLADEPFTRLGFRAEILEAIRRSKPAYFILERLPNGPTDFPMPFSTYSVFPELQELVRADYEAVEDSKFFQVFRRK